MLFAPSSPTPSLQEGYSGNVQRLGHRVIVEKLGE